jgi:hypothetical protein
LPQTILAAFLASMLVAASTLAARRWGLRTAGVVSAFPAIVGPLLVLVAVDHGSAAAARNAEGTLLGLVGLAAFTAAYGRTAARGGWTTSLLSGWAAAATASLAAAAAGVWAGAPLGLLAASISLWAAHRSLATAHDSDEVVAELPSAGARTSIAGRMALTAVIVVVLAGAVSVLGPLAGGILAALPVLASVLAVVTHRDAGPQAAVALLRGTLAGMAGFVAFCQIVALLITRTPLVPAFAVATGVALLAQAPALRVRAVSELEA